MSGTADNLLGGRSSLPISAPQVVNPLEAINSANVAATNMLNLRAMQAKQQLGGILQQATDANGNVDYAKAQQLAAQAGPAVQTGMAGFLQNNAALRGQQIDQAVGLNTFVANQGASIIKDPTDANVAKVRASSAAMGLPDSALAEIDRIGALPEAERGAEAWKHVLARVDALGQMARTGYPTPSGPTSTGNEIVAPTVTPPTPFGPGNISRAPGGIPTTMQPGQGPLVDAIVQTPQGPMKVQIPYQQAFPAQVSPAASNPPGLPQPGTIPSNPNVPSGTPPGRNAPPPGSPLRNPSSAASTAPTPTPPAAQTPPPGVSSPIVQTPSGPAAVSALPAGQQAATEEQARQSGQMGSALTARADQVPANKANYANMLSDLDRIGGMPAGGEKEVAINTFLQKATGSGITMTPDQIAGANSFAKLANIAVGQQLAAIGGTDARQQLFMGSNPNLDISKLGNQQIIHMLQGNEDAIQAKSRSWQDWQKAGNGPNTYAQFQDDFNHHFDPRVFQQQYMAQPEIDALRKSLTGPNAGPGAYQKFLDDVKYARSQHWIQ